MRTMYIVKTIGHAGFWGRGDTVDQAIENCKAKPGEQLTVTRIEWEALEHMENDGIPSVNEMGGIASFGTRTSLGVITVAKKVGFDTCYARQLSDIHPEDRSKSERSEQRCLLIRVERNQPGYSSARGVDEQYLYVTENTLEDLNREIWGIEPNEAWEISASTMAAQNVRDRLQNLEEAVTTMYGLLTRAKDDVILFSTDTNLSNEIEECLDRNSEFAPEEVEEN